MMGSNHWLLSADSLAFATTGAPGRAVAELLLITSSQKPCLPSARWWAEQRRSFDREWAAIIIYRDGSVCAVTFSGVKPGDQ
jgi:hypothetical protein